MEVFCIMIPFVIVLSGMSAGIYFAAQEEEEKQQRKRELYHNKKHD